MTMSLIMKFVDKRGDCWVWMGPRDSSGYGHYCTSDHRMKLIHRVVWELLYGPIPEDKKVYHTCRNKACCNPAHLTLKIIKRGKRTASDNVGMAKGSRHHNAKLTELDVRLIRQALGRGVTQVQIAKHFRVSQATINDIKKGEAWAWLV